MEEIERDLGPQPLGGIMAQLKLTPHQLVAASTKQLTHKMVSRAAKGRRLSPNVKVKIVEALNTATGKNFAMREVFNY